MPVFRFAKLVRDNIVDQQIAAGAKPRFRILDTDEHKLQLVRKIAEEAAEIVKAKPDDVAAEIADVQQAIDDLRDLYGLSADDIAQLQHTKNKKNGAFKKGLFVETVEVHEDDKWVEYYRQNADRYPEIKQSQA